MNLRQYPHRTPCFGKGLRLEEGDFVHHDTQERLPRFQLEPVTFDNLEMRSSLCSIIYDHRALYLITGIGIWRSGICHFEVSLQANITLARRYLRSLYNTYQLALDTATNA